VEAALAHADLTVISDYRHGLLSDEVLPRLLTAVRRPGKPVFVDSQVAQNESNHRLYRGDGVMCLNLREARCIDPAFEPAPHAGSFTTLTRELATRQIVVKLGDAGALALDGDEVSSAPAAKADVVDTTGAGDPIAWSTRSIPHRRSRLQMPGPALRFRSTARRRPAGLTC
jgi:sugar/nucleoside kinase (ribokinase family)